VTRRRRLLLPLLLTILGLSATARAAGPVPLPDGDEVARRIDARNDGLAAAEHVVMQLIDKDGGVRQREAMLFRRYFGKEKRLAVFFLSPATIKDTAFLTFDYDQAGRDDDQWLYLPAARRSRRIASSDRGDSFLGTDLSYDDVKRETKVSLYDYRRRTLRAEAVDGHPCIVVEATPVDERTARELGYGKVVFWADSDIWMVRKGEYWDTAGRPLKTVHMTEIRRDDGIWTPHRIEVENLQTGHRTVFVFDQVSYDPKDVPESLFSEQALHRGWRR
jgi:hypothetical protein